MGSGNSEKRRLEIACQLREAHPDVDLESLLGGSLAGAESLDRPPVPVWQYLEYQAEHPDISLEQIEQIRFPIVLHGGEKMVTSIFEMTHLNGPVTPTYEITVTDAVRLYSLMYEHGAMIWNANTKSHEEALPSGAYRDLVYEEWRGGLKSPSEQ
jgi:hypothetical protein